MCLITDRHRYDEPAEEVMLRRVGMAAKAGVQLVQVRERDMSDGALLRLVARAVEVTHATATRVLVNDRLDVALAAGAHGVHLRADSMPAHRVRAVVPAGFVIGRSVHSPEEAAMAAHEGGVDYLLFGTVYSSKSKPGRVPTGVAMLSEAVASAHPVPVLAVGGVGLDGVGSVARSGCAGFAAIGLFAEGPGEEVDRTVTEAVRRWLERR